MLTMNYTLLLTEQESSFCKDINLYTHLTGVDPTNLFSHATYPYFTYYVKKTKVKTVSNTTPISETPLSIPNNQVCITFANTKLSAFFLNTFKSQGKKFFYLDKNEATKDIERTWKILESALDFTTIQKAHFIVPHFTKIVYAYRMNTIYNIEINDITY